jgi:hypothetical protein
MSLLWHLIVPHEEISFWYGFDLTILRRCQALYRMPGASSGADAEITYAIAHNIPVFYDLLDLRKYFVDEPALSINSDADLPKWDNVGSPVGDESDPDDPDNYWVTVPIEDMTVDTRDPDYGWAEATDEDYQDISGSRGCIWTSDAFRDWPGDPAEVRDWQGPSLTPATNRTFESGAVRDVEDGKIDFEGHLSWLVLDRYGRYMNEKRYMPDGSFRSSDNWQKGFPLDSYMKSGFRHFMAWWEDHRMGYDDPETIEDDLCALLFNVMGYLHEILKERYNNG